MNGVGLSRMRNLAAAARWAYADRRQRPPTPRATPALWQTSLGLFDYWGCPWGRGDDVTALVERLRREGAHYAH